MSSGVSSGVVPSPQPDWIWQAICRAIRPPTPKPLFLKHVARTESKYEGLAADCSTIDPFTLYIGFDPIPNAGVLIEIVRHSLLVM
jgi:hypothetical protein